MKEITIELSEFAENPHFKANQPYRLGDLLIECGLVGETDLDDIVSFAKRVNLPLGRVCLLSGLISKLDLANMIRCQTLLRNREINIHVAKRGMHMASEQHLPFERVISESAQSLVETLDQKPPLAELFLETGLISSKDFLRTISLQQKTGLSFGRTLVLSGALSEPMVGAAIEVELMLRESQIEREQAVKAMRTFWQRDISIQDALLLERVRYGESKTLQFGKLLRDSGLVSKTELFISLEMSLVSGKSLGNILLNLHYLDRKVLETALLIQHQIAVGKICTEQGLSVLQALKDQNSFESPTLSAREALLIPHPEESAAFGGNKRALNGSVQ